MPVQARATISFKMPKLDFTKTLEEIADNIIIPDMRFGINRGIGVDNQPFPALEPSTIARKAGERRKARKQGGLKGAGIAGARGGTQQLVDEGKLRESFVSSTIAKNHIRINLTPDRAEIGYYLQVTGVGKKKKHFNFFGISQRAEFQAISKMKGAVNEALNR